MSMTATSRSWIVLSAALAAGCATTPEVRVQQAESGVAQCATFAWHSGAEQPASFTEQRVRAEALQTLEAKGYTRVDEKPDCRIAYAFSAQQQPRSGPSVGVGAGGGSRGVGGGIGVSLPVGRGGHTGTLTLDVVDASRNEQIWSGTLESSLRSADPSEEEIRRDVQKILAQFPDRP